VGVLFGARRGRQERLFGINSVADLIPARPAGGTGGMPYVSEDTARRHSAVWACLRLRADLISTMPLDVFRRVSGVQIEADKPPVLVTPGGGRVRMTEWLYSTQQDLDRCGNTVGIITKADARGYPAQIDLQPVADVQVVVRKGDLAGYRIGGQWFPPEKIWHERQYTASGLHVGLSPVAYAAWTIGQYLSVQQFATTWFTGGAVPRARLKNVAKTLSPKESTVVKESWKASIAAGEPFVHGSDWEYSLISAEQASADWIEAQKASVTDVARFFGCPSDLIDAAVTTGNITYANITQRNLQLLVMNVGPAVIRREDALSTLLPAPRYVKLNTDALLRMDPASRAEMIKTQIDSRVLAPSEARELDNRQPLTQAQADEFLTFWPPKNLTAPQAITGG
jgi:HK97 family phage portal protein